MRRHATRAGRRGCGRGRGGAGTRRRAGRRGATSGGPRGAGPSPDTRCDQRVQRRRCVSGQAAGSASGDHRCADRGLGADRADRVIFVRGDRTVPPRPGAPAVRPRPNGPPRLAAGAVIAVLACLGLAGCDDSAADTAVAERTSVSWPWETSPPTMSAPATEPRSMPSAEATFVPEATPSPEPTDTPSAEPTETPSPTDTAEPTAPATTSPEPPPDTPGDASGLRQLEAEVVDLVNDERTANGCSELRVDERLEEAARGHSEDMAERDYFDHTTPDGEGP